MIYIHADSLALLANAQIQTFLHVCVCVCMYIHLHAYVVLFLMKPSMSNEIPPLRIFFSFPPRPVRSRRGKLTRGIN